MAWRDNVRIVRGLFSRLCDPAYLEVAAQATVRGKRRRPDVAWFLFCLEDELAWLQARLADGTWQPSPFAIREIRDPKPRCIARVPIGDRVVHTAVVSLMEPVFLRRLRPEAFACRPGYGTHRAVLRLLELLRRHRWVLHLDIASYFPSVDLEILRALLRERIHDERFLDVVDRILGVGATVYRSPRVRAHAGLTDTWPRPGCGLPIGAYTSQLFAAHVYLADFDHFVKRVLRVPGLVRYVDDVFVFADRRGDLRTARREIAGWLLAERGLRLKHPCARVLSCRGHLDGLGYRITRDGVCARPRALRRMQRRLVLDIAGRGHVEIGRSIASTAGIVLFG